jgi:translation initiation factor 3 subunit G
MTIMAVVPTPTKIKWSEFEEDDAEDLNFLLPPVRVVGPDANGVKKIIEYKFDSESNKVKFTTTTCVRKLANTRLSKQAIQRRSLPKFGEAVHEDVGSRLTIVSTEEIFLERPRAPGTKAEENSAVGEPQKTMTCRACGKTGEHWTARCPYKNLIPETTDNNAPTSDIPGRRSYVPPSKRTGVETGVRSDTRRQNEENSVRVTNLSEDTREPDLHELFRSFGPLSRIYVAFDQKTGISRGFGFVNFVSREDAERAIKTLNGYGYDNLILSVDWAAPRAS